MPTRITRLRPFLIFGHRGSPGRHPENTIPSFEEALSSGADGIETDLRLLSDDTPILFHDDDLGERDVESLSLVDFDAAGTPVVRLGVLAEIASRATLILEVKRSRWEQRLLAEIAGWPNVIVASFDHRTIVELARQKVEFQLGLTTADRIVDLPDYAVRLGATWVFPHHRYVDDELVAGLHERNLMVVPWTANRVSQWDRLHAAGCDGVITDFPAEAVAWRSAKSAAANQAD